MDFTFKPGEVTVVTGPNGVGKSALLDEVTRYLNHQSDVEMFSGHRQITFQSDDVDQVGLSLANFALQLRSHPDHVNRYRNTWGEQHLKSVIKRVINCQNQSNNNMIEDFRDGVRFHDAEKNNPRAIDMINAVFSAGRLAVEIILDEGTVKARRNGAIYGIDRLSDGERAALLLVGAIVTRPKDSYIAFDEPERHLNPSISSSLISAAVRMRGDVGFIFATHDLPLIEWLRPDRIIHVRDSSIYSVAPETRRYKISLIKADEEIDEKLKYSILGSRKALLLVEGTASSEDKSLYSALYPGWNVVARGGWETLSGDVKSLRANSDFHWLKVCGIIDNDGRDHVEQLKLKDASIYSLPCPTIENLFFHKAAIVEMSKSAHEFFGEASSEEMINTFEQSVKALFLANRTEIVTRKIVWAANRLISEQKVSVDSIRGGQTKIEAVDLGKVRDSVESSFAADLDQLDPYGMLQSIPIKNTSIPSKISGFFGFPNFKNYKKAFISHIERNTPHGRSIKAALKLSLPVLPGIEE
ncbi:AAA family ATPase [Methylobacterium sp. Leaf93]|uniref:AAA family ATPase n=1 Tax=Methylobacterium sp. Leaf93 TaxID=1736249 RepID=UPI00138F31D8|nr:AAA family ATPase [Methylobacterium sp. Leaf93]